MTARLGWADVAKGLCMILVVMWHIVTKNMADVSWGSGQPIVDLWATLNAQLLPLRMPLFFTISGFFAARAMAGGDAGTVRVRALRWGALYVLWVLAQTGFFLLMPGYDTAQAHSWGDLLADLTYRPTNLWYLLALALYILVGRWARKLPTPVVLGGAAVLSIVASMGLLPDSEDLWQVFQNLVFFLAGARLISSVRSLAESATLARLLVFGTAFLGTTVAIALLHARQWPGAWLLLCILAVATGITLCALMEHHAQPAARVLQGIGRQTLPIYVLHMMVLAVVEVALAPLFPLTGGAAVICAVAEPIVLTALTILCCLGAYRVFLCARLNFLFDPMLLRPRRVKA